MGEDLGNLLLAELTNGCRLDTNLYIWNFNLLGPQRPSLNKQTVKIPDIEGANGLLDYILFDNKKCMHY